MKVLVVEDDYLDAEVMREEIELRLAASVETIRTEREFVRAFERLAQDPPDVIVIDVMLPWDVPRPEAQKEEVPTEVMNDGFYYAGMRCIRRLKADKRTEGIPYIVYTGLDQNQFPATVVLTKTDSLEPLIAAIRRTGDHFPRRV